MDKTPIEILDEVVLSSNWTISTPEGDVAMIKKDHALEAMKIFGKQCFHAGRNDFFGDSNMSQDFSINELRADNYLNRLEEKK